MTVQLVMCICHTRLLDGLQSIPVELNTGLKLEFENTLILAHDCDGAHVFVLIARALDTVDVAIGDAEVLGVFKGPRLVGLKVQLVIAQVELT